MQIELQQLKSFKSVWIYGAGIVGKKAAELLSNPLLSIHIDGVVVTETDNNPQMISDYKVYNIDHIDVPGKDAVFVVAVSENMQKDIVEHLLEKGFDNYFLWNKSVNRNIWMFADYCFENRQKHFSKVCFLLSGYKRKLWDDIFLRMERFVPDDVEVCILSSGLYNDELAQVAEMNGWSYLSTTANSVALIQNIAVELYSYAEFIYKMDEDIFLTENCFEKLFHMYHFVEEQEPYKVGFVAPLIPVNGYGYIRILNRLNYLETYQKNFERALYGGGLKNKIEFDAEAAKFMWGESGELPQLDCLNQMMNTDNQTYSVCGVRFSIGFILFHRSLWETMNGFRVAGNIGLGGDEAQLCDVCIEQSRAIIVAENTVVGHFSFGKQTDRMYEFYSERPELFAITEHENS